MKRHYLAALLAAIGSVGSSAAAQEHVTTGVDLDDAAPIPPGHASPTFSLPARDEKGGWVTPNRDLGTGETAWHLRVALNVAALGCRGDAGGQMVAAYNALLTDRRAELADASIATEASFQTRFGDAWRQHHDDAMTKLYNFFAQPPAQAAFCSEAAAVLREAAVVEPASFVSWADGALHRLEAPFTAFYAAFDEYRTAATRYAQRHAAAPVAVATPSASVPAAATMAIVAAVPGTAVMVASSVTAATPSVAATAPTVMAAAATGSAPPPSTMLAAVTVEPRRIGPLD